MQRARFALGRHEIEVQRLLDEEQLNAVLSSCSRGSVLLRGRFGDVAFHALTIYLGRSELTDLGSFGIGLVCADFGLPPVVSLQPEAERVLVGYDMDLAAIDVATGRVAFALELLAPFYAILSMPVSRRTLIFYEVGVMAIDSSGAVLWNFSKDIVQRAGFAENSLTLNFMDAEPVVLDLDTGIERR